MRTNLKFARFARSTLSLTLSYINMIGRGKGGKEKGKGLDKRRHSLEHKEQNSIISNHKIDYDPLSCINFNRFKSKLDLHGN